MRTFASEIKKMSPFETLKRTLRPASLAQLARARDL